MIWILLILTALPSVALMVFFYLKDKYEPEPRGHVVTAFLYGILVLIPALYAGGWISGLVSRDFLILGGVRADLYRAFMIAALTEEGFKYLLFLSTVARWREFDEPFDGIVYGVAVSLGLATVENMAYVFRVYATGGSPVMLAILRGVLAVPAHALYGAIMGYFVGRAKFMNAGKKKVLYYLSGFAAAWIFHGLYDFFCFYVGTLSGWMMLIGVSVAMWVAVFWMMPQASVRSPFKDDGNTGNVEAGVATRKCDPDLIEKERKTQDRENESGGIAVKRSAKRSSRDET